MTEIKRYTLELESWLQFNGIVKKPLYRKLTLEHAQENMHRISCYIQVVKEYNEERKTSGYQRSPYSPIETLQRINDEYLLKVNDEFFVTKQELYKSPYYITGLGRYSTENERLFQNAYHALRFEVSLFNDYGIQERHDVQSFIAPFVLRKITILDNSMFRYIE